MCVCVRVCVCVLVTYVVCSHVYERVRFPVCGASARARACVCVSNGVLSPLIVCEIVSPDPPRFKVRPTEEKK